MRPAETHSTLRHGSSKTLDILVRLQALTAHAADLPDGGAVSLALSGDAVTLRSAQRHLTDLGVLLPQSQTSRSH